MKGGQSGDLYVAIRVNNDPIFERDGRHLYIEASIYKCLPSLSKIGSLLTLMAT